MSASFTRLLAASLSSPSPRALASLVSLSPLTTTSSLITGSGFTSGTVSVTSSTTTLFLLFPFPFLVCVAAPSSAGLASSLVGFSSFFVSFVGGDLDELFLRLEVDLEGVVLVCVVGVVSCFCCMVLSFCREQGDRGRRGISKAD